METPARSAFSTLQRIESAKTPTPEAPGPKRVGKDAVIKRRGGNCHYCGRELKFEEVTLDHVIPQSRGGTWHFSNIVPACLLCNQDKTNMDIEEFRLLRYGKSSAGQTVKGIVSALLASERAPNTILGPLQRVLLRWIAWSVIRRFPPEAFPGEKQSLGL